MGARQLVVVAVGIAVAALGCQRPGGVVDLDGRAVDPLAAPATVLVFTSPGCPISNRYAPEIGRIAARYRSRVAWWLVYPDASAAEARAHVAAYGPGLPALRDPRHALARRAGVDTTPEAALFRGSALYWHGRIDDRFVDIGRERPAATRHDLQDAVDALLDGRAPPPPAPAVGCALGPPLP
jgi:hypothetical protein